MHGRSTILAIAWLTCSPPAQDRAAPTLDELCAVYRAQLLTWSAECQAQRLYTTAIRLNRETLAWGDLETTCRDRRRRIVQAHVADSKADRDGYRAFVASESFGKRIARFQQKRRAHDRKFARRLFERAESTMQRGDVDDTMRVLEKALQLTDDLPRGTSRGVERVWEAHLSRRRSRRSIDRLELGPILARDELPGDALDGKVVLWRSKSL